jgi:hypothetical protein
MISQQENTEKYVKMATKISQRKERAPEFYKKILGSLD